MNDLVFPVRLTTRYMYLTLLGIIFPLFFYFFITRCSGQIAHTPTNCGTLKLMTGQTFQ